MGESGHGAAPRRSRALPEETKRESSQRMGRLVLWLALAVLLPAPAILQPLDQAVLEEHEQMRELLTRMFVDNHREGRDLEDDMDEEEQGEARDLDTEEEEQTNLVDVESDNEQAVEAVSSNDPQEIARFNNYISRSATLTSGRTCTPTPSCPEAPPCTPVSLTACRRR